MGGEDACEDAAPHSSGHPIWERRRARRHNRCRKEKNHLVGHRHGKAATWNDSMAMLGAVTLHRCSEVVADHTDANK